MEMPSNISSVESPTHVIKVKVGLRAVTIPATAFHWPSAFHVRAKVVPSKAITIWIQSASITNSLFTIIHKCSSQSSWSINPGWLLLMILTRRFWVHSRVGVNHGWQVKSFSTCFTLLNQQYKNPRVTLSYGVVKLFLEFQRKAENISFLFFDGVARL